MKKYLFFLFLGLSLIACDKDNDDDDSNLYSTDQLVVKQENSAIMFQVGGLNDNGATPFGQTLIKSYKEAYGTQLDIFTIMSDPGPLQSAAGDSILSNFGLGASPSIYVNGNVPTPNFETAIEEAISGPTAIGVSHISGTTDSSYYIDAKVQLFKDTLYPYYFIQSYMLVDVQAKEFDASTDLNVANSGFTKIVGSETKWEQTVPNLDSTSNVAVKGTNFIHDNVVLAYGMNKAENPFGQSVGQYNTVFGFDFSEGDIIGTRSTPIRIHFLKENLTDQDYTASDISFLTVIWDFTGAEYKVVNSYYSK